MHHNQIKLWNPIIKLTPLNNYLSNCVITSSYMPSKVKWNKEMQAIVSKLINLEFFYYSTFFGLVVIFVETIVESHM
jgi:hypothetical protein